MYCPHCLTEVRRQRDIEQRAIESILPLLDNAVREVRDARDTALGASFDVKAVSAAWPAGGFDLESLSNDAIVKIRRMRNALYEEYARRYDEYAAALDTDNPACERCGYTISALV